MTHYDSYDSYDSLWLIWLSMTQMTQYDSVWLIMTHMTHYDSYDSVWLKWLSMTQYDSYYSKWLIWLTVTCPYLISSFLHKQNTQYIHTNGVVALKLMGSTWLMWVIWLTMTHCDFCDSYDLPWPWLIWLRNNQNIQISIKYRVASYFTLNSWLMCMRQRYTCVLYGAYKWHDYERSYEH